MLFQKDHIFIKLMEFGLLSSDKGFKDLDDWYKKVKATDVEKRLCNKYLSKFFDIEKIDGENKYFINADSYFNYIEYIELKEARKSSTQAFWLSFIAIIFSVLGVCYAIFGDVKLKEETTINLSKSSIESIVNGINK